MKDGKLLACVDIDNTDRHDDFMALTNPRIELSNGFARQIQQMADGLATFKGSTLYANKCEGYVAPTVKSYLNLT